MVKERDSNSPYVFVGSARIVLKADEGFVFPTSMFWCGGVHAADLRSIGLKVMTPVRTVYHIF